MAPKCLITGVSGFIGSYLAEFLVNQGAIVYGLDRSLSKTLEGIQENFQFISSDIMDKDLITKVIIDIRPDYVYHLAAQSLPKVSWEDPERTFQVNVFGTQYLLDAIRKSNINSIIEIFCSSGEYAVSKDGVPISEDHTLEPSSPYALSKIAQDQLSVLYCRAYQMHIVRVRPFFIIGPRKIGDVCSDFARGIVAIERGLADTLKVGNLDIVRDFLDVRDAVRAFCLVAERGASGNVYNICSGRGYRIGEIVENLQKLSKIPIKINSEATLFRSIDEPVKIGDNHKLFALGWKPSIAIQDSLNLIIESWRLEKDDRII